MQAMELSQYHHPEKMETNNILHLQVSYKDMKKFYDKYYYIYIY